MFVQLFFSCFLCCQLQFAVSQYKGCMHATCHECITDPVGCAWCSIDGLNVDQRCKPASTVSDDWCPGHKENPHSEIDVIENQNLTSNGLEEAQIKPQKIKLKLRVGEPMEFQFNYKAAKDYPMDLYFLLDSSLSMTKIRDEIVNKSEEIYSAMRGLTKDVHLGLGFFIDKNLQPVNNHPDNSTCYSFKHRLKLTNNLDNFKNALKDLTFGYNFDNPEGGLDGVAQVMACKEQIAWRKTSRKMIIFISDELSHSAGDGINAGITNPYDGGCYLSNEGDYLKEKEMDYPSTGIISKLAADEQYALLFVVPHKNKKHYKALSSVISGALYVGYKQDQISEKLSEFYKKISNNVRLDVNLGVRDREHFEITFDPDCTNKINCAVVIGEEKHINGTIKLRKYYGKDHIEIPIIQRGLKENLTLVVDIISSCGCEHESRTVQQSPDCSFAGARQCGICKCNPGRTGPTCSCDENSNSKSTSKVSCTKDALECNNHGECICDRCLCQPGFGGPYCEDRIDDCKRGRNGVLCSGHGVCRNRVCHCHEDWTGDTCECSTSISGCTDPVSRDICNNRGHCECGSCKCDNLPTWDVRGYQDEFCNQWPCENCHDRQCRALTGCIACHSSNNADCSADCGTGVSVGNASTVTEDIKSSWNVCTKYHHSAISCYYNFSYIYDEALRGIVLFVLSEPDCNETYYIYGGLSLLTLVVVGLATLIAWKLRTNAQDREEYMRFIEKARQLDEAVLNECYADPTTTFRNPMFKKSFRSSFR